MSQTSSEESRNIRLSLTLPHELNERLEEIAKDLCITKSDVLRRALALIDAAHEARKANKAIGVFGREEQKLEKEFIGI